ncbi:TetR/AcrR family transcriptional regulator [Kibdelosporangium philippinense]|uniref:TetR/AcrR family transcriptional regulator n=1 Tax=Kibdelosporangium philippinense TaxID=211113 RepID=A0ABS8ZFW2_9PSEU|nr:TetR/AcrR family transcriptional regulator [Kibdelosporangium philippinense]MCE7006704.1 TetR/AcrR family transcriptional regulator [Kibdelosporangium philippinense]
MQELAVLDAAEELFYERGIQAVGMDQIRSTSGVSLKRLYQLFPSKEALVVAYLERRDKRWRDNLRTYVEQHGNTVGAVFHWLHQWFSEPGFRGCAFINSFGELSATSPKITAIVQYHKDELRDFLRGLVNDDSLADQLLVLVEGAIVVAAIREDPDAAWQAKTAAEALVSG